LYATTSVTSKFKRYSTYTHNATMFSSKCETFALKVAYAWVAELFSKLGGTSPSQKN